MRGKAFFAIALVLAVLIVGCEKQRGGEHVINYLNNDILRIFQLEEAALKHYASVVGKNYTSDQALSECLKERVIPTYSRFVDMLEDIHPSDDDLRQLHHIYLQSVRSYQTGFGILLSAIEQKDPSLTERANGYITKGRQTGEEWRKTFFELCEKNGVKVIFEKKGKPSVKAEDEKRNK